MATKKEGNWRVYIYGVPMRLNDPMVRRYVYLSSARAAVKRFVAQGKRAVVANDPAEEENPAGIRAQVRRLPAGQIQIKIPLKRGETPHFVVSQLKWLLGKRVKKIEMMNGKGRRAYNSGSTADDVRRGLKR